MRLLLSLFVFHILASASAAKLSDFQPYSYEVRFTNPVCAEYRYAQGIPSNKGETLLAKPRGAYCKPEDTQSSTHRLESPQFQLVQWIHDPATKDIFIASPEFLNGKIARELCRAIEDRDIKVRFVLDADADLEQTREVLACVPQSGRPEKRPELFLRGGSDTMGHALNKFILFNHASDQEVRIVFSSGSLGDGLTIDHEAWHFVTTSPASYFAKAHICAMKATINSESKTDFYQAMNACRASIAASEEEDVKAFFLPADTERALLSLGGLFVRSDSISLASELFSEGRIASAFREQLAQNRGLKLRLLLDDSVYWAGYENFLSNANKEDSAAALQLSKLGAGLRFMQTNHGASQELGGNFLLLRGAGFSTLAASSVSLSGIGGASPNYQNLYLISVPEIVEQVSQQFEYMWENLATSEEDLPQQYIAL